MKASKLKTSFFLWSLTLVFVTLPMPKYSLNSQAIILLVISWLTYNPFREKYNLFRKNFSSILILSSIYIVLLFGMIYTYNISHGLGQLKDKIPFIIIPLIFGTTQFWSGKYKYKLIRVFSYSVVCMALFSIMKALYIYYNGLGEYFIYDKLSLLLNKHTTYYSLFCVIAISYFLYDSIKLKEMNRMVSILFITILLIFIYLLSARIAIVALILIAIYYIKIIITDRKHKFFLTVLVVLALLGTLFFSSNYITRFESISDNPNKLAENNEFNTRLVHWKSAIQTLGTIDYIFGKGTGDGKEGLYPQYLKNDFIIGYQQKYNAHNQYIEFLMSNGILGLIAYFCLIFSVLIYSIRFNDIYGVLIMLLFLMFSITESILERHSGILIVAILTSLIYFSNKELLEQK